MIIEKPEMTKEIFLTLPFRSVIIFSRQDGCQICKLRKEYQKLEK